MELAEKELLAEQAAGDRLAGQMRTPRTGPADQAGRSRRTPFSAVCVALMLNGFNLSQTAYACSTRSGVSAHAQWGWRRTSHQMPGCSQCLVLLPYFSGVAHQSAHCTSLWQAKQAPTAIQPWLLEQSIGLIRPSTLVILGSLASMCQVPAANLEFGLWTCQALLDNRSGFRSLCGVHRGPRGH